MQHKEFLFDLQFSLLLRHIIAFHSLSILSLLHLFETCNIFCPDSISFLPKQYDLLTTQTSIKHTAKTIKINVHCRDKIHRLHFLGWYLCLHSKKQINSCYVLVQSKSPSKRAVLKGLFLQWWENISRWSIKWWKRLHDGVCVLLGLHGTYRQHSPTIFCQNKDSSGEMTCWEVWADSRGIVF